ncbi:MAG: DRTGG domain-containing protein [Candidatus Hodarchaeales archaeon]|jgi:BioD-like phosphotransacetylase family protein
MSRSIYFTSGQTGTGKTSLAIAIALRLKESGKSVGYFKPFGWQIGGQDTGATQEDPDADFFKDLLGMKEDRSLIQPVSTGLGFMESALTQRGDFQDTVLNAFRELEGAYDYLMIEGVQGVNFLEFVKLSAPRLATLFDSNMIYVERANIARTIDNTLQDMRFVSHLGARVPDVVINAVPPHALELFRGKFSNLLSAYSIKVWGIIPAQTRKAVAPFAREAAKWLNGEILVEKGLDRQMYHLTVGAMTSEQALRYFRRKTGKAVITGGDRADICLAALETDTSCLILTGNIYPSVAVLSKAEEMEVPVILVPYDTLTTVQIYQEAEARETSHPRTLQQSKDLASYFAEHIDFDKMVKSLFSPKK